MATKTSSKYQHIGRSTGGFYNYVKVGEEPLEDGDLLEILWPDGQTSTHRVRAWSVASEHGIPGKEAAIEIEHNGATFSVTVAGTCLSGRKLKHKPREDKPQGKDALPRCVCQQCGHRHKRGWSS